jgi:hypothetical protein
MEGKTIMVKDDSVRVFAEYKKNALKIAKQLQYDEGVINKLSASSHTAQIQRILITARNTKAW